MSVRRGTLVALLAVGVIVSRPVVLQANCTIAATPVIFGVYDVFAPGALNSTGNVTYRCSLLTVAISIELSAGSSGAFATRTMRSGTQTLAYNLYRNAAATAIWGNGSPGTQRYEAALPPLNTDVVLTVYGRVPPRQSVSAGTYSDTIVVTINF